MTQMRLQHQQLETISIGAYPGLWFQHSYPETDTHRAKSELYERVRDATGNSLTNIDFNVGWARVQHGQTKTHAMTILAKQEDHREIREVIMKLREEDSHRFPIK